jgi:autotransporter-associated beta strand protein
MKYLKGLFYFSILAQITPLSGATFTVTNNNDTGSGSFRQAIMSANVTAGSNTIVFAPGVGALGPIVLGSPLPPIGSNISGASIASINTNGNAITINGNSLWSVFFVSQSAPITIGGNFQVVNGKSIGGNGGSGSDNGGGGALGAGGGIFVAPGSTVTIQGVNFSGCSAQGGNGGMSNSLGGGGGGGGGMSNGSGGAQTLYLGGGGGGGFSGAGGSSMSGGGGGGGGGLFFEGGSSIVSGGGGGGGGSDAQPGQNGGASTGGAGGADSLGNPGGVGGAMGGGNGGNGTGNSGGGGGGENASGSGGQGGNSALGAGGGGVGTGGVGSGGNSTGSFGGGGGAGGTGAMTTSGTGGNGGNFGGGGGGASSLGAAATPGGNGGFGGGGGGAGSGGSALAIANVGNGGFGAGGGGGYSDSSSGQGGFGGGNGANPIGIGGGGGALGGTIFVSKFATLNIQDPLASTIVSAPLVAGTPVGSALGQDIFLMSGGAINFQQSTTFTINTSIQSDNGMGGGSGGGLAMSGSGILALAASNNYTGSTFLIAGTVQVSSDANLGNSANPVDIFLGNLEMTNTMSTLRTFNLAGSGTITVDGAFIGTLMGQLTGGGGFQKSGTGTLVLSGNNNYSGVTTISNGVLRIDSNTGLPAGNSVIDNSLLLFNQPTTLNFSGSISGSGGLTRQNADLILSGTNSYTGTTTIANGTLEIDSNGGLPPNSNVVDNGLLLFKNPGIAFVGGSISGPGSLTMQGSGNVILAGKSNYTGPTSIQSGILTVDGSVTSPITVSSGAILEGTGFVQNVTVNGTLAPGDNGVGTLNANNVTFSPGSTYLVEFSNTGSSSLAASNNVTINSNSTLIMMPDGFVSPQVSRYTIVTSPTITYNSQFNFTNPFPRFILEVLYDPSAIYVLLTGVPYNLLLPPGNAQNVAACFSTLAEDNFPDINTLIPILDLQLPAELLHAFNQMQPANFDNIAYAEMNIAERIRQIFTNHYFEQRVISCPEKEPWRLWIAPFFEKVRQYGHELKHGYREKFGGFTAALDYRKKELWIFSAGFSFAGAKMKVPRGKTEADFNTYAGTLGTAWSNKSYFADLQFSYLYSPIEAQRKMDFEVEHFVFSGQDHRKAKHDNRQNQVMGHFGAGFDFKVKAGTKTTVNIYPFGNVDYIYVMQSGYKERGAESLNLKVHGKRYDLLRPEGGLGIGYNRCFKHIEVMFDIAASYVLEFRFFGKRTKARFKKEDDCHFFVKGLNPENHVISPEARLRLASLEHGFSFTLGYHGEFGEHFRENAVEAELRKAF